MAGRTSDVTQWSLPSRERGLKLQIGFELFVGILSLPSRERGLKCRSGSPDGTAHAVAPLAGAWIEIADQADLQTTGTSLPSRERGLKSP